ncbi:hypothetical protein Poli38472_003762 [Pythium oligandrum]|uniref:Strictosidine synthase conserved region domain-containing protein n=1 Tax=Pythium oligandrum TaxID=41045 RepID=A0A8K1CP37_PYTOL|nr:hypothetical protein Poli38472_003762 [Pythium oligandrum]|eukprot:TMW65997.1 hypothetical protein Poli38472_003762 [Pythium oligandrum]
MAKRKNQPTEAPAPAAPAANDAAPPPPGITAFISKPVLFLALAAALMSLALDYVSAPIEPQEYAFEYQLRTLEQQSRYEANVNSILDHEVFQRSEIVLQDEALAPEALAVSPDGDKAFVSLRDGRVAYLTRDADEKVTLHDFARTGEFNEDTHCKLPSTEPVCGRPLGLAFVEAGPFEKRFLTEKQFPQGVQLFSGSHVLLVADAYKGLLLMDATGAKTLLFDSVGARKLNFLNALTVASDGNVYLTESSRRYKRNSVVMDNLERRFTGRLLHFDPRTGRARVLAKELGFPNGIVMAEDDKVLLIAVGFQQKIVKYTLATKELTDFAYLPGQPDNLDIESVVSKKVLLVGMVDIEPLWRRYVVPQLKVRKFLSLVVPQRFLQKLVSRRGTFAAVDLESGEIQRIYEDSDAIARYTSGVQRFGEYFYVLSWARDNLVRIPATAFN